MPGALGTLPHVPPPVADSVLPITHGNPKYNTLQRVLSPSGELSNLRVISGTPRPVLV